MPQSLKVPAAPRVKLSATGYRVVHLPGPGARTKLMRNNPELLPIDRDCRRALVRILLPRKVSDARIPQIASSFGVTEMMVAHFQAVIVATHVIDRRKRSGK